MKIAIVMGSSSDWNVMKGATEMLKKFGVEHEVKVLSAHRTPHQLEEWASNLRERGFGVIIAGAGWAAHLAGVVAAYTTLPVIGVPVKGVAFEGMDALFSMVQMPTGIPVAVVALNGAKNAAILAVEILAVTDAQLKLKIDEFRKEQEENVLASELN